MMCKNVCTSNCVHVNVFVLEEAYKSNYCSKTYAHKLGSKGGVTVRVSCRIDHNLTSSSIYTNQI
jgi:hypothetical protein